MILQQQQQQQQKKSVKNIIQIGNTFLIIHTLLNLIIYQPEIEKIYLFAEDTEEMKYQFSIHKPESAEFMHFNASIEYSNDMDEAYENIEEYYPSKNLKIFIVFDDMIDDILSNKNPSPIVTETFIKGKNSNISVVFITQTYSIVPQKY